MVPEQETYDLDGKTIYLLAHIKIQRFEKRQKCSRNELENLGKPSQSK